MLVIQTECERSDMAMKRLVVERSFPYGGKWQIHGLVQEEFSPGLANMLESFSFCLPLCLVPSGSGPGLLKLCSLSFSTAPGPTFKG